MRKHIATFAVAALAITTGAFAHDAYRLRVLDAQKQIERDHTIQIALSDDVKVMPVGIVDAKGPMRRVAVTIADLRAMKASPAIGVMLNSPIYTDDRDRQRLDDAPVARPFGNIDCRNGRAQWLGLDFATSTDGPAVHSQRFRRPNTVTDLPDLLQPAALHAVCSVKAHEA